MKTLRAPDGIALLFAKGMFIVENATDQVYVVSDTSTTIGHVSGDKKVQYHLTPHSAGCARRTVLAHMAHERYTPYSVWVKGALTKPFDGPLPWRA